MAKGAKTLMKCSFSHPVINWSQLERECQHEPPLSARNLTGAGGLHVRVEGFPRIALSLSKPEDGSLLAQNIPMRRELLGLVNTETVHLYQHKKESHGLSLRCEFLSLIKKEQQQKTCRVC